MRTGTGTRWTKVAGVFLSALAVAVLALLATNSLLQVVPLPANAVLPIDVGALLVFLVGVALLLTPHKPRAAGEFRGQRLRTTAGICGVFLLGIGLVGDFFALAILYGLLSARALIPSSYFSGYVAISAAAPVATHSLPDEPPRAQSVARPGQKAGDGAHEREPPRTASRAAPRRRTRTVGGGPGSDTLLIADRPRHHPVGCDATIGRYGRDTGLV